MPTWYYFCRPTNLAFHDLTTIHPAPPYLQSLLGLSLKFCPVPKYTSNNLYNTFNRLHHDLHLKTFFAGHDDQNNKNNNDNDDDDDDDFDPKMYVKSHWKPPSWTAQPEVEERFDNIQTALQACFRRKLARPNLLPHQTRALRALQQQETHLVVQCDKNLGPAIIEREVYIKRALSEHLNDITTYKPIPANQLDNYKSKLHYILEDWLKTYSGTLSPSQKKFICHHIKHNKNPFPVFYLTMKVHKQPWKTRPIVSCSGSLLHPLGTWVNQQLQLVSQRQPSFFKNSFELKKILSTIKLPPNARVFSADAVSMYTNIPTDFALNRIGNYLREDPYANKHLNIPAVMKALRLIMKNNVFLFGDCAYHQQQGTAMGTPPAPPYATLYYAIHEAYFLPRFRRFLLLYKRFIDDVLGIWLQHPDPSIDAKAWQEFQDAMNSFKGLVWEFTPRTHTVDFMDLTITLRNDTIHTKIFEKALNLYLYIPSHSAHPAGVLSGLIQGNIHRAFYLCSDLADVETFIQAFYNRLIARGYQSSLLKPAFLKAIAKHMSNDSSHPLQSPTTADEPTNKPPVIMHLTFHPDDPSSSEVQQLWKTYVIQPQYKRHLSILKNHNGNKLGLERLIIAYSRPPNLGNKLSYRRLDLRGPPVSSYLGITD